MNLDNKYIFDGNFGLERETFRVTADGKPALSPHPFPDSKYFDKDFCENQLELITPVCKSVDDLMETLTKLDNEVKTELEKHGEYLWMNSNPPHFEREDDIKIAKFDGDKSFKLDYRLKLEKRYGRRLMTYSGIHFNFSFTEEFLKSIYDGADSSDRIGSFKGFTSALYFRMSKYISRYGWLLVLLTAASPVYDLSLDGSSGSTGSYGGTGFDGCGSRRNGEKGYWNKFLPYLDYTNLETYVESIDNYIKTGELISAAELYLPMRLKPRGANSLDGLLKNGVDHIELRMFDINPLSPIGIMREDLEFAHYFIIYLSDLPDFDYTPELQKAAIKNHRAAAGYDLDAMIINGYPARDAAAGLLDDMLIYYENVPKARESIKYQLEKLTSNSRYCVRVYETLSGGFREKTLAEIKKQSCAALNLV